MLKVPTNKEFKPILPTNYKFDCESLFRAQFTEMISANISMDQLLGVSELGNEVHVQLLCLLYIVFAGLSRRNYSRAGL